MKTTFSAMACPARQILLASGGWTRKRLQLAGTLLSAILAILTTSALAQNITYNFNDGTMQGWKNTMVSSAAAGYYDLSFGAATKLGHDNWGAGPNPTWSVTGGGAVPPTGPYFLGAVPWENQIGTTIWSKWPAASSGAQQTIMAQSPAFTLNGSGALTYLGCGSSKGVPLTTLSAIPVIGGTWGVDSGNLPSTLGSCAVGLLRDDGVFIYSKDFNQADWATYTITAAQLTPYVNDGHSYTLNVVDFWSGQNSWCAIDDVSIPGALFISKPTLQITYNAAQTGLLLTLNASVEGQCSVLSSDDLSRPLSNWTEVTNVATQNGLMSAEVAFPATQTFYRARLNPPVPSAPTSPVATAINTNSIILTWTNTGTNQTGFKIEQKTGSGGTYVQVATVAGNVTTCTITGLTVNTLYFFRIQATNTSGASVYSTEASVTMPSTILGIGLYGEYFSNQDLSGTPTLTRTNATINFSWGSDAPYPLLPTDNFSIRWSGTVKPQFSESYTFYTQSDDGVRLWVNGVQLVNNWTGHSSTENSGNITLSAGQQYEIRMEYFDSGGDAVAQLSWSSTSTPKAIIPQTRLYVPTPPAAPSGLISLPASSSEIDLTWTDNANNELGFKIERKIAGGTFAEIATVGANVTNYADVGLNATTQYFYQVKAYNVAGASTYSAEANATTPEPTPFQDVKGGYYVDYGTHTASYIGSRGMQLTFKDGLVSDGTPGLIYDGISNMVNGKRRYYLFGGWLFETGGAYNRFKDVELPGAMISVQAYDCDPAQVPNYGAFKAQLGQWNSYINTGGGEWHFITLRVKSKERQPYSIIPDWIVASFSMNWPKYSQNKDWGPYNKYVGSEVMNRGDNRADYVAKGVNGGMSGQYAFSTEIYHGAILPDNEMNALMYQKGQEAIGRMGNSTRAILTSQFGEDKGYEINRFIPEYYRGAFEALKQNGVTSTRQTGLFGEYGAEEVVGTFTLHGHGLGVFQQSLTTKLKYSYKIDGRGWQEMDNFYSSGSYHYRGLNKKNYFGTGLQDGAYSSLYHGERAQLGMADQGGVNLIFYTMPVFESNRPFTSSGTVIPFANGDIVTKTGEYHQSCWEEHFIHFYFNTLINNGAAQWYSPGMTIGSDPTKIQIGYPSTDNTTWIPRGGSPQPYVSGRDGAPVNSLDGLYNRNISSPIDAGIAATDVIYSVRDRIARIEMVSYQSTAGGYTVQGGTAGGVLNGRGILNENFFDVYNLVDQKKGLALLCSGSGGSMIVYYNGFRSVQEWEMVTINGRTFKANGRQIYQIPL